MSDADRIFDAFRDLSAKIHRADAERERIEHLREIADARASLLALTHEVPK